MKKRVLVYALFVLIAMVFVVTFSDLSVAVSAQPSSQLNYNEVINSANMTAIQNHVRFFTGLGSRLTGYPGSYSAAPYIYNLFESYGLSDIQYQNYTVTVPVDYGANVTVLEPVFSPIKAYPLWPNFVATVSTPSQGITGHLIYVGDGELSDFDGKIIHDSIVLMKFDSGLHWLDAAKFGAKAVIFIPPDANTTFTTDEAADKSISIPISFPRLYVTSKDGQYLLSLVEKGEVKVRITSSMRWEAKDAMNIIGFIRGTTNPEKIIVLTAYYDSFSIVPSLSPGAEEACGIASLLELAKFFRDNPPKFTVMFVALAGHHQGLAGSRTFVEEYAFQRGWNDRIMLLTNLDLNTQSSSLACMVGGGYYDFWSWMAAFIKFQKYVSFDLKDQIETALRKTFDISRDAVATADAVYFKVMPYHLFPLDHQPMVQAGGPGFSFVTAYVYRQWKDTPFDTFDHLNFKNLEAQLEYVYCVLYTIANLSIPDLEASLGALKTWQPYRRSGAAGSGIPYGLSILKGTIVEYNYTIGWYSPIPNALLAVCYPGAWAYGSSLRAHVSDRYPLQPWWDNTYFTTADENGDFMEVGLQNVVGVSGGANYMLLPFVVNSTGSIIYAPDYGKYIFSKAYEGLVMEHAVQDIGYLVAFRSGSIVLFDTVDPRRVQIPEDQSTFLKVSNFKSHARPYSFGWQIFSSRLTGYSAAIVYTEPNVPVEITMQASYATVYPLAVLINASERYPEGVGYAVKAGQQLHLEHTSLKYAMDLYWLNDLRMTRLVRFSVLPAALSDHTEAGALIDKGLNALVDGLNSEAYQSFTSAWSLELGIYSEARSRTEDVIFAVPYFVIVLIPFAFILERILISFSGLKRISTLTAVVVASLSVFYFVHPGFTLTTNLVTLVVGVFLLILILPILGILGSAVQSTFQRVTRRRMGIHFAEISRGSAFMLAFSTGIENIRKMKARSAMTVASIVLMITGLVCLTSISGITYVSSVPIEGTASYNGILVRPEAWGHLRMGVGKNVIEFLRPLYGSEVTICPRAWLYCWYLPCQMTFSLQSPSGVSSDLYAILGVTPQESEVMGLNTTLTEGRWFLPTDSRVCIVSKELADFLQVKAGEKVSIAGITFKVIGIIDDQLFESMEDLDQERITPLILLPQIPPFHSKASSILIIPYEDALALGGMVMSVSIKFADPSIVTEAAKEIFKMLRWNIYAASNGKISLFTQTTAFHAIGLEFQILPVVIAILSIFNIVLGTVYQRRRDIEIYSVVGLSPLHVAGVYTAETTVYAVMGVVFGYILSVSITALSSTFMPGALPTNYSSSWVLLSLGLSILSVMIASAYPAYSASRLVSPTRERVVRIATKPVGDEWEIPFPFFAASEDEAFGMFQYMKEYLNAHMGESAELFSISNLKFDRERKDDGTIYSIIAEVRLTPYQVGVRQLAELYAVEDPMTRRYSFALHITRRDGELGIWMALNKNFYHNIREQLLLWRGLPPEEKTKYQRRLKEA